MCSRRRHSFSVPFLLALFIFTGCASTGPFVLPESPAAPTEIEIELRQAVSDWKGTPYEWGGETRAGLDCSAFTQILYRDVFDIHLPRTTETQVRHGDEVDPSDLLPGDLVFFRPEDNLRHVGVYLGRGEFAHVSSSQGVTISRLNQRYWRNRYWTARRLPIAALRSRPEAPAVTPPDEVLGRKGW